MKTIYVNQLVKTQIIDCETFAVQEVKQSQDKNGKPYYDLTLIDKTGAIKAKIWSDQFNSVDKNLLKPGKIVSVCGKVDEFRGINQLTITKVDDVDEAKLEDYLESSAFDSDEMWTELLGIVEEMQDGSLKQLLHNIFAVPELLNCLKYYPAGVYIHHGFRSGLLQHILEIIKVSVSIAQYYPYVNFDLVITGAILHDLGKYKEFKIEGATVSFSLDGMMVGHMIMSYEMILKYAPQDMDQMLLMKLKNMILSHHGKKEVGCPVLPMTIEAALLSSADDLIYKVGAYNRLVKHAGNSENQLSEYDNILGTRIFVG